MRRPYLWIFITWALLLSLSFLSCPLAPPGDGDNQTAPDLIVSAITHSDSVLTTDNWTLGARVSNTDAADAAESTLKYYLSSDAVLNITGDTLIGSKPIGSIAAGSSVDDIWSTTYSIDTEGNWYIFAVADADSEVAESNEENNSFSAGITVSEPASQPDLTVTGITIPVTAQTTADSWELGARVSNIHSSASAGASNLKYYRSADAVLDIPGDIVIGEKAVGPIAAGSYADDVWSTTFSISETGTWYIFAVADADSEVAESDEENNTLSDSADIIYDRIVIETFSPTGSGDHLTWTNIALFDSSGDPSPGTPYDDTDALADDAFSNSEHMWYARIDTDVDMGGAGLAPGTYYIKVRGYSADGLSSAYTGPYGIRVVTDPAAAYSDFGAANPSSSPWDDSYEDDGDLTGGIPDNPLGIELGVREDWHNRALSDSDIDWFILTID